MRKLLIIGLLFLLAVSCKKEATVWDTDWNTPLINDTLFVDDLVNDSTIQEDPGGYYYLGLDRLLYQMGINDIVEIPDTTIIENFTLAVPSITIAPGFSFVNSTEEHDLLLPDAQLRKIILKNGIIDLVVKNPIGTKAIFKVQLPGVIKDGIPFSYTFVTPAGTNTNPGISTQTIDLSGYEIDLRGVAGVSFNKLQSNITVTSDPTGPSVTMTNSDITIVEATFKDVLIDYAQGYFGNYLITDTIQPYLKELDIYESGILDLPNTTLSFEVENGMKLGAEGLLTYLKGKNSAGNQLILTNGQIGSSFNVDPATGSWNTLVPSVKTITFNSSNSNVVQFMENLPSMFDLGYRVQLNPWGNISGGWDEIFPNSKVKVRIKADMPLMVGMDNLVLRDTFDLDMEQNLDKTHVVSGKFILELDNAFPLGAEIYMTMLDENDSPLNTVVGSAVAEGGQFGQYDALLDLYHARSNVDFILNEDVVKNLDQVKRVILHAKLNTTNPVNGTSQQMMIPIGAFLGVKLRAEFKTRNIIQ